LRRLFALVLAVSAANLAVKTLPFAQAPVYVAAAIERLQSPVRESVPVAAIPPACLLDPSLRTTHLVAAHGPRQYFVALQGDCPPPATISTVLSLLRIHAEPPAGFWSQAVPKAKAVSVPVAVEPPPRPSRGKRPRTVSAKPVGIGNAVSQERRLTGTDRAAPLHAKNRGAGAFEPFGFLSDAAARHWPQAFGGDR
jgi:hypothetical protein